MIALTIISLACVEQQGRMCTREFAPVCANKTTYSNLCTAKAAGFYGSCAKFVVNGPCSVSCSDEEFLSEKTSSCVKKPWYDFESCEVEKNQGACANGADPNPWVAEHCMKTCDGPAL